ARPLIGVELRNQVVLANRPVHPDLAFGHVGTERAIGLVQVGEGALVRRHRQLGRGDLQHPCPAGGADVVRHRDVHDDLPVIKLENAVEYSAARGPAARAYAADSAASSSRNAASNHVSRSGADTCSEIARARTGPTDRSSTVMGAGGRSSSER